MLTGTSGPIRVRQSCAWGTSFRMLPVHRWFSFDDQWPLTVVEQLLDRFQVTSADVVYDPFVGCGTTALAAATRECDTISRDANPIAALVTHFKLNPPLPEEIAPLVESISPNWIREAFRDFSCGVQPQVSDGHLNLLRFLLAVAVLRTRWHLGSAWVEEEIASELRLLVAEISHDTKILPPSKAVHRIDCADFLNLGAELPISANRRAVLITSPPFYGSDRNPRVQRLTGLLGLEWPALPDRPVNAHFAAETHCLLEAQHLTAATLAEGAKHFDFLAEIAHHVTTVRCSDVAIEMSGAMVGEQWVPFDEFLGACLTASGYQVDLILPLEGRQECERLVCGRRA